MSTRKIDDIITEFRARVSDPATFVSGSLQDGQVIPAAETMAYVNRAFFKLEEDALTALKGDRWEFAKVFPEMIATGSVEFVLPGWAGGTNGTHYDVASPYLDFGVLLDISYGSGSVPRMIGVQPQNMLSVISTEYNARYVADANSMTTVADGRRLYLYPDNAGAGWSNVALRYIRLPLDPVSGSMLVQNGAFDSPYYPTWNTKLAEIAEQLYMGEAQLK